MPLMNSRDPLTGIPQPVDPGDVMLGAPMMAAGKMAGPAKALARTAITPEAMKAFKDEMYKRYIAKFFAQTAGGGNPTPMSTVARGFQGPGSKVAGLLPAFLGGGPQDIELPAESGIRDPRLGPGSLLDMLKMSKAVAARLMR